MSDQIQPEAGGSRGCLFAALGVGCLLVLLLVFTGAGFFYVARSPGVIRPMRGGGPTLAVGQFPTDMVTYGQHTEAAFCLYSEGDARRADFGRIRLEWPGRGASTNNTSKTTITLAKPAASNGSSSISLGSAVQISTSGGVTTGRVYEASFTIKDGILTLDGQAWDAINGRPTVLVLDRAGKITAARPYGAPIPTVEPAKPAVPPEAGKDREK